MAEFIRPSSRALYDVLNGTGGQTAPPKHTQYNPPSFDAPSPTAQPQDPKHDVPVVIIDPINPPAGFYTATQAKDENIDQSEEQEQRPWSRITNSIRNTPPRRWIALGATVVTLFGVAGAAVSPRGKDALGSVGAFFSAQSVDTKKEFIPLPAPDCLDTAFTAKTDAVADMIIKKTIIDKDNDAAGTLAARAKAAKDPKYVPPKEFTKTGFFDDAKSIGIVQAQMLPREFFYTSSGKSTDAKDIEFVNRLPVGQLTGEIPFAICLAPGVTMNEATTQYSPTHISVDTSKFVIAALESDKVNRGYEVFPPTTEKGQKESLFSFKESQRIFKLLAPQGKYDAKTNTYKVGEARNEVFNDQLKLSVLGAISSNEYGIVLQKAARSGFGRQYSETLEENVVINFEGAFKTPKAVMADTINAQPETTEPPVKFINVQVNEFTPDTDGGVAS